MPETTIETPTRRILIVDDDPIFTALAEAALADAGYDIEVATDGVEALETLDRAKFSLALIDLSMPRIDGFRLIGLIRGAFRLRSLAIVVVSARDDAAAFEEAIALGANGYCKKPIDWETFPSTIEKVLRGEA